MIVKNCPVSISKAKTTKVRPVIDPEVIEQPGSRERGKSRVFVEV